MDGIRGRKYLYHEPLPHPDERWEASRFLPQQTTRRPPGPFQPYLFAFRWLLL